MSPEHARIRISHRVEWLDTDAAGIYHWTTVARFAEAAEAALHNALGIAGETFGHTPRLSVSFQFKRPLRFNDDVAVEYVVASVGVSSVTYDLTVLTADGDIAVVGAITTCLVDGDGQRSRPWPEHIRAALSSGGSQAQA